MKMKKPKVYKCDICEFVCDRSSTLKSHNQNMIPCTPGENEGMVLKEHKCIHCDGCFRIDYLDKHTDKCRQNPINIEKRAKARAKAKSPPTTTIVNNNIVDNSVIPGQGPAISPPEVIQNSINTQSDNITKLLHHNCLSYDHFRLFPYQINLDIFTLSSEEVDSILFSDETLLVQYFRLVHCNLDKPNFLNIYYIDENYVYVFTENGWKQKDLTVIMDFVLKSQCESLRKYAKTIYYALDISHIDIIKCVIDEVTSQVGSNKIKNLMIKNIREFRPIQENLYNLHKQYSLTISTKYLSKKESNKKLVDKIPDLENNSYNQKISSSKSSSSEDYPQTKVKNKSSKRESSSSSEDYPQTKVKNKSSKRESSSSSEDYPQSKAKNKSSKRESSSSSEDYPQSKAKNKSSKRESSSSSEDYPQAKVKNKSSKRESSSSSEDYPQSKAKNKSSKRESSSSSEDYPQAKVKNKSSKRKSSSSSEDDEQLETEKSISDESSSDIDEPNIIDIDNNLFQYQGQIFTVFFIINKSNKWDAWVKLTEVTDYLKCENTAKSANIMHYIDVLKKFGPTSRILPHKDTEFINLVGFMSLIRNTAVRGNTNMDIKEWLKTEVLPLLDEYKSPFQSKELKISSFYSEVLVSNFYEKAVVYIGYIGKINGSFFFKYGLSRHMFERDYEQHSKKFSVFEIVFIGETDNCERIELLFEQELKTLKLYRKYKSYGKEFFTVSTQYSIEFVINNMKNLIDENPLPSIIEAKNSHEKYKLKTQLESKETGFTTRIQKNKIHGITIKVRKRTK